MTPHDLLALQVYRLLARPSVRHLRLTDLVLEIVDLRMTRDEAFALLDKIEAIHQRQPQPDSVQALADQAEEGA